MHKRRGNQINLEKTGLLIKLLAERNGYTGTQLSKLVNVASSAVYSWYNGHTLPTVDNFLHLSILFDVPVDRLIVATEESFIPDGEDSEFITDEWLSEREYKIIYKCSMKYDTPFTELIKIYNLGFQFGKEVYGNNTEK
ncbi:MAG: helix-turn-helix transcriptional regulator [Bacillota bacterium]|nr:helix-turn-helix transcriptional regulator [Bacillota bacterium]